LSVLAWRGMNERRGLFYAYREASESKNRAENELLLQVDAGLKEDGHGYENDEDVGGDVEYRVGDEMVGSSRALNCEDG
jgi:hypothetical protein